MVRLRFGCSGWDYQEWIGPVYRNASESKLRAYSRIFDTAEINSTFYRAPSPGMVQGWARFTPEDFVFAAKVPQTVTHDRLLDVAAGADKDLLAYCELMRPLLDAGKLGSRTCGGTATGQIHGTTTGTRRRSSRNGSPECSKSQARPRPSTDSSTTTSTGTRRRTASRSCGCSGSRRKSTPALCSASMGSGRWRRPRRCGCGR